MFPQRKQPDDKALLNLRNSILYLQRKHDLSIRQIDRESGVNTAVISRFLRFERRVTIKTATALWVWVRSFRSR